MHLASRDGHLAEVLSLLTNNPGLDVNWALTHDHFTALHAASWKGHTELVTLLLAHPAIHVNAKTKYGQTPLSIACENGEVSVVQVLLKDPRVDVTLDDLGGRTALWNASCHGQYDVIEWLMASGRWLGDVRNKKRKDLGSEEVHRT